MHELPDTMECPKCGSCLKRFDVLLCMHESCRCRWVRWYCLGCRFEELVDYTPSVRRMSERQAELAAEYTVEMEG